MRRKTIKWNEPFKIQVMLYDGEFNLSDRVEQALRKYGFIYKMKERGKSVLYGGQFEFSIQCDGVQQLAIIYAIIGGDPDQTVPATRRKTLSH